MAVIKFLCLFVLIPLFSCRQINSLPFEKVQAYLNDDPTSDYEIVSLVHNLHRRSLPSTLRIRAFQQDIELYLEPNENYLFGNNTPVYLSYGNWFPERYFELVSYDGYRLYHDLTNRAALVVEEKEGKHLMYGIIGDYIIRPSTSEEQPSNRNKRSSDGSENILTARDNEIFADDHVLVRMNQPKKSHIDKPGTLNRRERSILDEIKELLQDFDHKKQGTHPEQIYPEILVTADYNYFMKSGGDVKEFVKYQVVFWNGVDLLFRYFENPKIRLNIAGIVISQETEGDIYSETDVKGNQLHVDRFLNDFEDMRSIHDEYFPKISYDMVVALTNYELVDDSSLPEDGLTFGIAFVKSACRENAIAVIRDLLSFHAITVATHEIGHLFGAIHDFENDCKTDVPEADYIMSYDSVSENQVRWSACSLKYMEDFFKTSQASCLRNKPNVTSSPYKKILPGKVADLTAQCDSLFPGSEPDLYTGVSVCHQLFCVKNIRVSKTLTMSYKKGAAEGSSCENQGICIQGECIQPNDLDFRQTDDNRVPLYRPFIPYYRT